MAITFVCPKCETRVEFPSAACQNNCPSYQEFLIPGTTGPGLDVARIASLSLVEAILAVRNSEAYHAATSHGASSSKMQELISPVLSGLGFEDERKKRIGRAGFRADFLLEIPGDSVMVELERGKTLDNNMDMLDLWKCHILEGCRHLILLVPVWYVKNPPEKPQTRTPTFSKVWFRLTPFFEPGNYTNVCSLHLIGY